MMPEILTESFCERCGTRYTFESAAPRKIRRLGQFKTLSKGLKNYVLSDETSMDEAMALARGDQERETTAQQLDAFHATFNFCMNCRQYTCGNCWNQVEGRCLTCAPHLGQEILQSPFPDAAPFEPIGIAADAWPTADLPPLEVAAADHAGNGSNGFGSDQDVASATDVATPAPHGLESADDGPGAHFSFLSPDGPPTEADVVSTAATNEPVAAIEGAADGSLDDAADFAPADVAPAEVFAAESAPVEVVVEPVPAEAFAAETAPPMASPADLATPATPAMEALETTDIAPAEAASPAPEADLDPLSETVEERATTLASHTSALLGRFRPGQNIDAELEAFEAGFDAALAATSGTAVDRVVAAEPEPVAPATQPEAAHPEAEPIAASVEVEAESEPEPIAVSNEPVIVAEPEPIVAAEPEPEPIAAVPEPEPQPIAASVEPEPQAAAPITEPAREDRVPQPTWRIFAPDQTPSPGAPPFVAPVPPPGSVPGVPLRPPAASTEPQWPAQPDWQDSPSVALLTNHARQSSDALWAASSQEVLAPAPAGPAAATAGVQPCSSCGLSLSATARFCRRCGTRQG
jgi:hypothetical protein